MHYLVIAIAFLAFAAIAPMHVTIVACIILILIPTIVRYTAKALAGVEPTFGEAFKAVALSLFFVALSAFMLGSAMGGIHATGAFALVLFGGFFAAYVLGFKVSLGTSFGASAAIAAVSTVVSVGALWLLKSAF
jgi:hypothetical protein